MWISSFAIETDEFPEVNPPVVTVAVPYPGASPETVEREVVVPMEDAIGAVSGVDKLESTSADGFARLTVTFTFDKDVQQATQDIRDKISAVRASLPPEMEEPTLTRFDPQDLPIASLALSGPLGEVELTRLADPGIVGQLRSIPGVADATVVGGVERELTVELHPRALSAAHISVPQVVQALRAQNIAAPVGRVQTTLEEKTIRLRGRFERPEDFRALVLSSMGEHVVRLGDVATVRDGGQEPRSLAVFNGAPAVGIDIKKATNASTTTVSAAVEDRLIELRRQLPPGVELTFVQNAGERVKHSVLDVEVTLLVGAALTVLVVFLFLASWRSTVITGLALPVSVLASFIAVAAFGFTLNSMSLLGLSLAIGILIDDAIVVRENIVRHLERGQDHVTASIEGTNEIGLAVTATTFAIVVVFVPVAFMGGIAQQWFAPFALTIAASVLVSLFVSFSLDPMLSAVWADPDVGLQRRTAVARQLDRFHAWLAHTTGRYERMIRWALRHRAVVLVGAVAIFVAALAAPATGLVGSALFPMQDRSELYVVLESLPGASLEYTRRSAAEAEAIARSLPEVRSVYTTLGGVTGEAVDEGLIYVRLVERSKRGRSQSEVERDLRSRLRRLAGVRTSMTTGFFQAGRQIQVRLTGPDLSILQSLAERAASQIREVPGAVDVALSTRGEKPELEVVLDRPLASELGVSIAGLADALRPAFAGIDVGDWVDPSGETRDVTVRLDPAARARESELRSLPLVITPAGSGPQVVPLDQVARVVRRRGPAQIQHLDGKRVITVGSNTEGAALSRVVDDIEERIARIPLPMGYSVVQGGETENQREVFGRILAALLVAVMLMYLILVVQFRSFLVPIAIMASLPLSLIGVMGALVLSGSTLNLMSMIGVILLMGIVAKNAILLVDFARSTEASGAERKEALVQAGSSRFRPIVMTSVAVVAGMLPVAIGLGEGGDFRAPLGRAVIGGVITSTILTLLVIPTVHDVLSDLRERGVRLARHRRVRRADQIDVRHTD